MEINRKQIVWIVVADNNSWGAGNRLCDALDNAHLPRPLTAAEWFGEELDLEFDVAEAAKNWADYGKHEAAMKDGREYRIVIHRFDPELWRDYEVNPFNGAVTMYPRDGVEADWDAEIKKTTQEAVYVDGVLTPKEQ